MQAYTRHFLEAGTALLLLALGSYLFYGQTCSSGGCNSLVGVPFRYMNANGFSFGVFVLDFFLFFLLVFVVWEFLFRKYRNIRY